MPTPIRRFRCRTAVPPPSLPCRIRSTMPPDWVREPPRTLPTARPGSPGLLEWGQEWRADGARG